MKYDTKTKREYLTPQVELFELHAETFTMASGLEDYEENTIFGVSDPFEISLNVEL